MDRGSTSDCQRAEASAPPRPAAARRARWLYILPLVVLLALIATVALSGAWRWVSLDALRDRRAALSAYVHLHPVLSLELYALAYMVLVALSLPGALIMSLAGGYLFGAWMGAGSALVGETAGAVLMYGAARTALGAWISTRLNRGVVGKVTEAVRRNAVSALLALRLMPGLPFGLVNLAAGLAGVPFLTYLWTTVVGIAPSTFIYCSVGSGLGRAFTRTGAVKLHELITPDVWLPLAGLGALGLLPLAYKAWRVRQGIRP